jgi:hypothetical protein
MSAIASFKKVNKSALEGLKKAAVPKRTLFGGTSDEYEKYLAANTKDVTNYTWSGFVLATLLPYLDEQHGIDLMHSEHDELAEFLTDARQATHFIFTDTHRAKFLDRLKPEDYPVPEMLDYFNQFNETNERDIGLAMRDGIRAIQECLQELDSHSVVLFSVG